MDDIKQIEHLLDQVRSGDRDAWARLLRRTYGELKRIAHRQLWRENGAMSFNTTGLVNEWCVRLYEDSGIAPNDRQHYFALAAIMMRNIICGYAREHLAAKRGGGCEMIALDDADEELIAEAQQFVALDQALDQLAERDPRLVEVVQCRYFAGMTEAETAEATGKSLRGVQRAWAEARHLLAETLGD